MHNHFFVSASTPTAAHIPIKMKEKSWANQFIEFTSFWAPNPCTPSMVEAELYTSQEPAVDKAGRQQTTKWEPLTFSQLTTAWNRFTAVLLVKSSELALVLAHHMEVVLHIAEKRGDWVYYDVAFQGNVAKNEACWGQTYLEVFVFAMLQAHGKCTGCTPQTRGQPKLYIPLGACISFHHTA